MVERRVTVGCSNIYKHAVSLFQFPCNEAGAVNYGITKDPCQVAGDYQ